MVMRRFVPIIALLSAMALLSGCLSSSKYAGRAFKNTDDKAVSMISRAFVSDSQICAEKDLKGDSSTKGKTLVLGYENAKQINDKLINLIRTRYLVSEEYKGSYGNYSSYSGKRTSVTNKSYFWLGQGVRAHVYLYKSESIPSNSICLSIDNLTKNDINKAVKQVATKEQYLKILKSKRAVERNIAYHQKKGNKNQMEGTAAQKERDRRSWNAYMAGISKGLSDWNTDMRNQRSRDHDMMMPGVPKRWEDMTDQERADFGETVVYNKYLHKMGESPNSTTVNVSVTTTNDSSNNSEQLSHKLVTRYVIRGTNKNQGTRMKLIGDYSYEVCFSGGISKGKCSPRKEYIYSQTMEEYLAEVRESTCSDGSKCDSFGRLVSARKGSIEKSLGRDGDYIKSFNSQRY